MIPIKLTKTDYGQGWADGHKAAQEGRRMDEKKEKPKPISRKDKETLWRYNSFLNGYMRGCLDDLGVKTKKKKKS